MGGADGDEDRARALQQGLDLVGPIGVTLDQQGSVESLDVVRASDDAFIPATTAAVKQWRFKPAQKGGETVRAKFQLPVQFSAD